MSCRLRPLCPRALLEDKQVVRELWRTVRSDVLAKGLRYWALAGVFIVAGMVLSYVIERGDLYLALSYGAYQQLQRTSPFEMDHALNVVFVAVGDDEFWKGELEQRIPIKRDYLARLVAALDQADPWVLGIDFTLRSPLAEGGLVETPAYAGETAKLIAAVEAFRNHVVLPATVNEYRYDRRTDSYPLDSSVFGSYKFANPRVRQGYLNIPHDIRTIPLTVRVTGTGATLSSFSQVIADILDPQNRGNRASGPSMATITSSQCRTSRRSRPSSSSAACQTGQWRTRSGTTSRAMTSASSAPLRSLASSSGERCPAPFFSVSTVSPAAPPCAASGFARDRPCA